MPDETAATLPRLAPPQAAAIAAAAGGVSVGGALLCCWLARRRRRLGGRQRFEELPREEVVELDMWSASADLE